jgi:glycosyltransferase involved in cell wall biosynthesis
MESGFVFDHKLKNSFEDILTAILNKTKEELVAIGNKAQKAVLQSTNYKTIYAQKSKEIEELLGTEKTNNQFDFIEIIPKREKIIEPIEKIKGLLSIVIPYYNLGDYIEETILSLTKVEYSNVEIIIVNDGSNEEASISKLEAIKEKYKVTIFNKENEGLSLARNYGADRSKGEYLVFLDADDTVGSVYYSRAIEVLKQYNNVSFVGCWAQYFGSSTDMWPTFNPEPPYLQTHNMINSSGLVYKKEDFLKYGKNDPNFIYGMEDYDSVISMVKNGARGVSFPELWWNYRIRKNSMAQSFTRDKELYLYKLISEKHKDFFALYADKISNLLNYNGAGIDYNNPTWAINSLSKRRQKFMSSKVVQLIKKNTFLRTIAKKAYHKIIKK